MLRDNIKVDVSADTTQFDKAMQSLSETTLKFGETFSSTIASSIQSGKSFEDTIRSIGKRFADLALKQALKPIENSFGTLTNSLLGAFGGGGAQASGIGASVPFTPFAKGGVVSSATAFSFGERLGVMGEAGSEAIMPLARGADGRLGVAASGGGKAGVNVVFNVSATDAASFKKSEGQVTAMLARAVARGQRGI